jgi:hypothetical protein
MKNIIRVLRTVKSDLTSYGGFKYPEWNDEPVYVECPDWNPTIECGNGLHGITRDINGYKISQEYDTKNIKWMVLEVDENDIILLGNKVKFKGGNIIYCGDNAEKAILMVFDNLKDYLKNDSFGIRFIDNPSLEVQLAAVNQYCCAIRYIDNPNEQVQLAAVKQNGCAICYIKNPHPEILAYLENLKK